MICGYSVIFLSIVLFLIGIAIFISKKTFIMMLIGAEFSLNSINLLFVFFSKVKNNLDGQIFVIFSLTVAAIEVATGIAIAVILYRKHKIQKREDLKELKG